MITYHLYHPCYIIFGLGGDDQNFIISLYLSFVFKIGVFTNFLDDTIPLFFGGVFGYFEARLAVEIDRIFRYFMRYYNFCSWFVRASLIFCPRWLLCFSSLRISVAIAAGLH